MRKLSRPAVTVFANGRVSRTLSFVMMTLLLSCARGGPLPLGPPFIRGDIAGGDSARVLVESVPRGPTGVAGCDKAAYIDVSAATRVLWPDGRPAGRAALVAGRTASVWITDLIADSCPVQVEATVIIVEPLARAVHGEHAGSRVLEPRDPRSEFPSARDLSNAAAREL